MRRILLLLGLLLISLKLLFSQNFTYNIKANFSYPYIANIREQQDIYIVPTNSTGVIVTLNRCNFNENYSEKLSGKISGQFIYQFNKNFFFGGGIQFNLLRFQQTVIIEDDFNNLEIGQLESDGYEIIILRDSLWGPIDFYPTIGEINDDLGKSAVLYTEIPLQFGYSFLNSKLRISLGLTTSFLTYSEVIKYNENRDILSSANDLIINDKTSDGLNNLLFNGNAEIEYSIFNNLGIVLNYSRSLNSIYDKNSSIGKPKYNIFSIGLSYSFLPKKIN